MQLIVNNVEVNLIEREGIIFADSKSVAGVFEKRHADVIEKINSFGDRAKRNFRLSEYYDSTNRTLPCFEMNRDGFMFLVMGFTGAKAENWKLDFIDAFNLMEEKLKPTQQIPSDPMQVLKIMFNAMEQTNSRLDKLEQTSTIDSAQQQKIQSAIARRVRELQSAHNLSSELRPKLFSRMYGMVKREFHVGSYKDIQKVRFDEAIVKISGTTLRDGVL